MAGGNQNYDKAKFEAMREKSGYDAAVYEKNGYDPAIYEKNGYDPAVYEKNGYDPAVYEKNGIAYGEKVGDFIPPRRKNNAVWLIIGGCLVALVFVVLALLLIFGSSTPNPTPVAVATATTTTGFVQTNVTPPARATNLATVTPILSTPTSGATTTSAPNLPTVNATVNITNQVYQLGKNEYDSGRLEEAQKILEQIKAGEPNYEDSLNLLFNIYIGLGKNILAKPDANTLDNAKKVLEYFGKANTLNPNNPELTVALERAKYYHQGRTEYEQDVCHLAVGNLQKLYDQTKATYLDTAPLYYNCLIKLGEAVLNKNGATREDWQNARNLFEAARNLEGVPDKGAAQAGSERANLLLNPPTPTPAPVVNNTRSSGGGGGTGPIIPPNPPPPPPPPPTTAPVVVPPQPPLPPAPGGTPRGSLTRKP